MKKIAIILFLTLFAVTCSSHNSTIFLKNDHKIVYKRDYCNSDRSFPQMILIPYFNQASQIVPNCKTYPVHKTAMALFIFYHNWLENFGDKDMVVRGMLEKVMIKWGTEKRVGSKGYDLKGQRYKNRNVIGLVETDSIIWVWQGYHHKISESALIHELVHLALRAKNGTADPDHEGHKYRGWTSRHSRMIIEAKKMLRAFNL
jgi:hypothetical protein